MPPAISVIIPSYNPHPEHLGRLIESLRQQTLSDFEVVLVDDASTAASYGSIVDTRIQVVRQAVNQGPAACRNAGAAVARAPYLFFTDTDCRLGRDTLTTTVAGLVKDPVCVGNTITDVETPFGKAVALLGFPGGGCIGFHEVWRVSPEGYSTSFSSCNVAFRRETYEALGGFNAGFPVPGGEDTVLARRALEQGVPMRYLRKQVVYHAERASLAGFIRWQVTRGRGNYYIKQYVPKVGGYLRLRLWTFRNSFRHAGLKYAPAVFLLLVLSVLLQVYGLQQEHRRAKRQNSVYKK